MVLYNKADDKVSIHSWVQQKKSGKFIVIIFTIQ